ncbi:MAG TPA: penicillin-binding protein [Candidatus Paceibacterota bacterium]|nr:penicillin-binding protein [Candidatus Paceibacterota bacterium]
MPIPALKIKSPRNWEKGERFGARVIAKRKAEAVASRKGGSFLSRKGDVHNGREKNDFFKRVAKKIFKWGLAVLIAVVIFAVGVLMYYSGKVPTREEMLVASQGSATKIYDRTGTHLLYYFSSDEKRVWIPLDQIPEHVRWAVISVEDDSFYEHHGFDVPALIKVAMHEFFGIGPARGGSTITQQLVKNVLLSPEHTYIRKFKEMIFSYYIEKKFSKDEILEMYFNVVPYGSTAYGIEAAAGTYFGKHAKDLDVAEGAVLAAMLKATTYYSPYGSHVEDLIARQKFVLSTMAKLGYITTEQEQTAKEKKLEFKKLSQTVVAPHYTLYVKELLAEKYGEEMAEKGGLKVITSLDYDKQQIAEEVVMAGVERNEKNNEAHNAALVSIDPKTGEVLAMVGSKDYFNEEFGAVNVALRPRQPGSSFKPIVYAASFLEGLSPETILFDTLTTFRTETGQDYTPRNYSGKENGPVSIRKALGGSLNIPAVKTIYLVGIDKVLNLAEKMGYTTFGDRSRFGLSLVLGGGEVKLAEHTQAFGVFAQNGIKHNLQYVLKVEDKNGKVLEEFKAGDNEGERVINEQAAKQINSILSDNSARAWIFGEKNYLTLPDRPVAAKTGTTNDFHDGWTMGYTPSLVTGVWVGNNDNKEMKGRADGSVVAGPIWNEYMRRVLAGTPVENFEQPETSTLPDKPLLNGQIGSEIVVKVDKITGKLATDMTPAYLVEEKRYQGELHDILQYVKRGDLLGVAPEDPSRDPMYAAFEAGVKAWAEKNNYTITTEDPPADYDDVHTLDNQPNLEIIEPRDSTKFEEPTLNITIETSASRGIARAEYYIDNELLTSVKSQPFNLSDYQLIGIENGEHFLKVVVYDDVGNFQERNIRIYLDLSEEYIHPVSWISPKDGQGIALGDFPIDLKVRIKNGELFKKIDFYSQRKGGESVWVGYNDGSGSEVTVQLDNLETGEYNLYAVLTGTSGKVAREQGVWVTVGK